MLNCLLDNFPTSYEGYAINTNFTVGIKLSMIFADGSLSEQDKLIFAGNLLFKDKPEDIQTVMSGISWFLSGGDLNVETDNSDDENGEDSNKRAFDFAYDSNYIYSAFKRSYPSVNLKGYLHWFEFLILFRDLSECALTRIMEYRTADLSEMSEQQKKSYRKLRDKYALPPTDDYIKEQIKYFGKKEFLKEYANAPFYAELKNRVLRDF